MTRAGVVLAALVGLVGLAGCRSTPPAPPAPPDAGPPRPVSLVAARPYALTIPRAEGAKAPRALVVILHGYGSNGSQLDAWWGFSALAEREDFLVAAPDGTVDARGSRFWHATSACCDFDAQGPSRVDDVAYVGAVIDDAAARTPVDPQRVFVVGHSNGGFMAHRLACDLSGRVAAVVSLAGAADADPAQCVPRAAVSVLQVNGTDDNVIKMDGGRVFGMTGRVYPSVAETMSQWSARLGCTGPPEEGAQRLDLDARIPGAETRVDRYRGCRAGLELWTIDHGSHGPSMTPAWAESVWAFLQAHPKAR